VEGICQPIQQWVASASVPIGTVVMTCTPSLRVIPEPVSVEQTLYLTQTQGYKIKLNYSRLIAALIYSFLTFSCLVFHCKHIRWLCDQLGGLASVITGTHSSMSTAFCRHLLNFHLLYILLQIFQPSQSRSSPSTSLCFSLKYFLFNICYNV